MDVSLILTHRCNLACGYCYAGEHHRTDMDPEVLERAVGLLGADGSERAQLGFFGGEPFLGFEAMKRAVELAEQQASARGQRLVLQVTTNGSVLTDEHVRFMKEHQMHVTVSIDGVREAHDHNRPRSGGKGSFDQVRAGLRRLLDAGVKCDAMMVITPRTARFTYRSVSFLWSEGVQTVRANLDLAADWTDARHVLREELVSIGWEMIARRVKGETVSFKPFERGMTWFTNGPAAPSAPRAKAVVGTSGHLYPCAPMVGEDRDDGPTASLRLGHLDDGPEAILAAVKRDGVSCDRGGKCQCAAYLETGDRYTAGRMGNWYGRVCAEIGEAIAESLAKQPKRPERPGRRRAMIGLTAIVSGAAVGAPLLANLLADDDRPRPCRLRTRKQVVELPEDVAVPGEMPAYPDPEPDGGMTFEPEPEPMIDGEMEYWPEPEPEIQGQMVIDPVEVEGDLMAPE